jgi:hypothetical protein
MMAQPNAFNCSIDLAGRRLKRSVSAATILNKPESPTSWARPILDSPLYLPMLPLSVFLEIYSCCFDVGDIVDIRRHDAPELLGN